MNTQSKLMKIEKCISNGVHQSWEGHGKTYFKFMLEFENNTKGIASILNPDGKPYVVGKEYTFTISTDKLGNIKISNLRSLDQRPNPNYGEQLEPYKKDFISHWDKPEVQWETSVAFAAKLATKQCLLQDSESQNMKTWKYFYEMFINFIYDKNPGIKDLVARRQALEISLDILLMKHSGIKTWDEMLIKANQIFNLIKLPIPHDKSNQSSLEKTKHP